MTDYQRVALTAKKGRTLTLKIEETNSDVKVLSELTSAGQLLEDSAHELRKFVAMILCEYHGYENAITADAREQGWGFDDGDQIVEDVRLLSLHALSSDDTTPQGEEPRCYEATLLVTLVHQAHADALELESWDTAADPNGDLDNYFD